MPMLNTVRGWTGRQAGWQTTARMQFCDQCSACNGRSKSWAVHSGPWLALLWCGREDLPWTAPVAYSARSFVERTRCWFCLATLVREIQGCPPCAADAYSTPYVVLDL